MKYAVLIKIDDEKFRPFVEDFKQYLAIMGAELVYEKYSKNRMKIIEEE